MTIMLVQDETLIREARAEVKELRKIVEVIEAEAASEGADDMVRRAAKRARAELEGARADLKRLKEGRLIKSGEHAGISDAEARRMLGVSA
ncbi:MAG: hypothetical protein OXU37_06900 [Thaumarchaeota archaeon]|nr:hypothetical protein [Nitrososphaerota archaeon]